MEDGCNVIIVSPIAQQPSSGIKHRLQAIQETLRRAGKQTVAAINLRRDEGCDCRSRCLERQRFDAAFQETKLTVAATDGPGHVVFHRPTNRIYIDLAGATVQRTLRNCEKYNYYFQEKK